MPARFIKIATAVAAMTALCAGLAQAAEGTTAQQLHKAKAYSVCDIDPRLPECQPVGQGAELGMVNVQSMVSNRQMAVQLATNMLASMNNCDVCANIGH